MLMKSKDKLNKINDLVEQMNKRLKNRTFKVEFKNLGANNYCLFLGEQLYKFNTFDDVLNCLGFITDTLSRAIAEIEQERKGDK